MHTSNGLRLHVQRNFLSKIRPTAQCSTTRTLRSLCVCVCVQPEQHILLHIRMWHTTTVQHCQHILLTCCHFDVNTFFRCHYCRCHTATLPYCLYRNIVLYRTRINIALITLIVYLIQLVLGRRWRRRQKPKPNTDIICDVFQVEMCVFACVCARAHPRKPYSAQALFTLIHRPFLERY